MMITSNMHVCSYELIYHALTMKCTKSRKNDIVMVLIVSLFVFVIVLMATTPPSLSSAFTPASNNNEYRSFTSRSSTTNFGDSYRIADYNFNNNVVPVGSIIKQWKSEARSSSNDYDEIGDGRNDMPIKSPATGLRNQLYNWKQQYKIRYQTTATTTSTSSSTSGTKRQQAPPPKTILLFIHGLFTNSDHWRNALRYFSNNDDIVAYAIDLYGCGYSDKPIVDSASGGSDNTVKQLSTPYNGESRRFPSRDGSDGIMRNVQLGTANGQIRSNPIDIELLHPTNSPFNFYSWADLIADFCTDIIVPSTKQQNQNDDTDVSTTTTTKVTLVCNSIGTISSLQAVLDHPILFNGVFVVSPNFRELHSAEVPFPSITMPIVRFQQYLLRNVIGQSLFTSLAKPNIVRDILKVPYAITEAVDEELVQVLLDPLLAPGASNVVFDTLSYSAGPLPEPQLQQLSNLCRKDDSNTSAMSIPVWICYGTDDPWTPSLRVDALQNIPIVERVIPLPNIGHCPHDEAPELVHPLLLDFIQHIRTANVKNEESVRR